MTVLAAKLLARRQHPVHPRQQFLRAVVGVQDHRHAIRLRRRVHIVRARDAALDRPELRFLAHAFPDEELRAAIRELNHRRRVHLAGRGQRRIHGVGADAVDRRQRELVGLGVVQQLLDFIAKEHAGTESFGGRHATVSSSPWKSLSMRKSSSASSSALFAEKLELEQEDEPPICGLPARGHRFRDQAACRCGRRHQVAARPDGAVICQQRIPPSLEGCQTGHAVPRLFRVHSPPLSHCTYSLASFFLMSGSRLGRPCNPPPWAWS